MRFIFLGKKPGSVQALEYLFAKGAEVAVVVAPPNEAELHWSPKLSDAARDHGITLATSNELYQCIADPDHPPRPELAGCVRDIDFVVSFLFWEKIRKPLIEVGRSGCINFHPAPLPDFRGVNGYSVAILENLSAWGVSAHFVSEDFDTGDIIAVDRFPIQPEAETAFSLEQKSQKFLLGLFMKVMDEAYAGKKFTHLPQGEGRYVDKKEFERLRHVTPEDSPEAVERKVRAFWYPPYGGAAIEMGGREYTLVSDAILKGIGPSLHRSHQQSPASGWIAEEHFRACVENLTVQYVDVLLAVRMKDGSEKFLVGKRRERPAKGFWWFAGGRSRHFLSYQDRAEELVKEDFGIMIGRDQFFCIGGARHFWPDSRFVDSGYQLTTDGDVILYAAEIDEPETILCGRGFTEVRLMSEHEARQSNKVLDHAISSYKFWKQNKMLPPGGPPEFRFEY